MTQEKINIAELLKDCPQGMELDCTMYNNVHFVEVTESIMFPITINAKNGFSTVLTKYGQNFNSADAKCVIFPKGKTTWEGFVPPYFKVGDVVQDVDAYRVKITEVDIENDYYVYESVIAKGIGTINFSEQDNWKLAPNKFDINTLVPFESRVLVRDTNGEKWKSNFWGFYDSDHSINHPHECCGNTYRQCIPYEGNKHLLGKTDDCDDYYKTWE